MGIKEEIIDSRNTLRKIHDQYMEELHSIFLKIDKMLERIQDESSE